MCCPSLNICRPPPPFNLILVGWGWRTTRVEISCSHMSGIPATVSQHFGCPTGGVWKEPASQKQQCLGFLTMAFLPAASSWAVKTGAHGRTPVAVFSRVLSSSHPLHRAFSKPVCSGLCRTSLAFLLLSPKSSHLPHLHPSKDSLFPQHELLRKGTVR